MKYNIKAIETKYKGYLFRSRLEARWAAMFDLLGWQWDYEPVDFNGWIPDFAIYGTEPIYVEVKPVIEFPEDVARKMIASGCKNEMLIIGQQCSVEFHETNFYESCCIGWLIGGWSAGVWESSFLSQAVLGRWSSNWNAIGMCSDVHSYCDRISGSYDGGSYGTVEPEEVKRLWATAHAITRWSPENNG